MIWPVPMRMVMHDTCGRQLFWKVGMGTIQVIGMVVTAPQVLRSIVGDQQTFSVMPAIAEDVVVFLAFGGLLILAQAVPLAMRVLDDAPGHLRSGQRAIAGGFEKE